MTTEQLAEIVGDGRAVAAGRVASVAFGMGALLSQTTMQVLVMLLGVLGSLVPWLARRFANQADKALLERVETLEWQVERKDDKIRDLKHRIDDLIERTRPVDGGSGPG